MKYIDMIFCVCDFAVCLLFTIFVVCGLCLWPRPGPLSLTLYSEPNAKKNSHIRHQSVVTRINVPQARTVLGGYARGATD